MLGRENNPTQQEVTAYVELGEGLVAHRYGIIGTSHVEYVLLVETQDMRGYSSFYSCREPYGAYPGFDGWLADFTTASLPPILEALKPGSRERMDAVDLFFGELKHFAASQLRLAFPQDF